MAMKMLIQVRQPANKSTKEKVTTENQLCNYSGHICPLNQLDGYRFCIRHILEDVNAPYRQCSFVYPKNGKRCPNAAPKIENKESYCSDHTKKILQARQRSLRKYCPTETLKTVLDDVKHYTEGETTDTKKIMEAAAAAIKSRKTAATSSICKVLDYASNSESDTELPVVAQTWKPEPDSDAESLDSDYEDPLRHAGVYTVEEAALIAKEKMVRLQSLYILELKRLNHVLRERRKVYTQAIQDEKETLASISATPRFTPEEDRQYNKLKAMLRYHSRRGPELILHKQACEIRQANSSKERKPPKPPLPTCVHTTNGSRCSNSVLPFSRYCMNHVLNDPKQVLYKPCRSGERNPCNVSVFPIIDGETCLLHLRPGPIPRPVLEEPKVQEKNKVEPMAVDGINSLESGSEIPEEFIRGPADEEQIATK